MSDAPDYAIRLSGVTKAFAGHVAVKDLSLGIRRGDLVGILGPNGAGKTTTLRMIMNIFAPDRGTIEILGRPADQAARDRVGYLPEERGLYPRMVLEEQLLYLAEIKGMSRREAARRLPPWLERLGLLDWKRRRVNELSKGMQQKAQIVSAVLHAPDILILDEPMSGLDPVGANLMRDVLLEFKRQGVTIVISSHQMDTVERLCDAIVLIHRGEIVLEGAVRSVKSRFGKNTLVIAYEGDGTFLSSVPGVGTVNDSGRYVEVKMVPGANPQAILREVASRLVVSRFEIVEPSLHDIFVDTITARGNTAQRVEPS